MMTLAVALLVTSLSKISTSEFELTTTPEPAGTLDTAVPLAPKLPRLLASTLLWNTRVLCPGCDRLGMLNTRMPPVLPVATLSCTSASMVFSISMPATFCSARQPRTITLRDWPT